MGRRLWESNPDLYLAKPGPGTALSDVHITGMLHLRPQNGDAGLVVVKVRPSAAALFAMGGEN